MQDSPILWSCFNAQLQSLKKVLKHGALVTSVDAQENNCFHKAVLCTEEFSGVLKDILHELVGAGADINKPNNIGYSPLYLACVEEKHEYIENLLILGADVNQQTSSGGTALMETCCKPNAQIVNEILKWKPDTTITNRHGLTALALACYYGRLENVKALINYGADVTVHDRKGRTPLYTAMLNENIETALEIMATPTYLPKHPATEKAFTEHSTNMADAVKIEDTLMQELEHGRFKESYHQLPLILYWAVSNNAVRLAQLCISHYPQLLHEELNGATWLHIVAHGNIEIVRLLLQMLPEQSQKVGAIIDRNSQGESPLTVSIGRRYKSLEKLFWDEIRKLGTTDSRFMRSNPAMASRILEILAQYETPGQEYVLKELLQLWFHNENSVHMNQDYTTLDWAVDRSQVTVLWWLLSKGGYSSGDVIARALRLIPKEIPLPAVQHYVKELLLQPPPILDIVANPNTDDKTSAPAPPPGDDPFLEMQGSIVDIYSNDKTTSISFARASVRDIVYDAGPESLMAKAKEDLNQSGLNVLKMKLDGYIHDQRSNNSGTSDKPKFEDSSSPPTAGSESQPVTAASDERSNRDTSTLTLRWIHLPVNEDLVRRLSHDLNRSELEHSALMKHFNRSWTELAAGGKRNYMKPQCVTHPTKDPSDGVVGDQALGEGITCMALYMPYLTVGRYKQPETNQGGNGLDGADGRPLDETMNSRNSRKVLHMPMTIDQYYYPTIPNTDTRDSDQVVSKFLNQKHNPEKTILMLNNLWIWIIDQKTIITASAEDNDQESKSNLLQTTLNNILYGGRRSRFERATTVQSVKELILGVAVGSFIEKSIQAERLMKGPIEIFRESIRRVTDEETRLFDKFLDGLNYEVKEPAMLRGDKSWLNSSEGTAAQNRHHIISSETKLLQRTRDIYDEIQILRSLAEDQDIVWKQVFSPSRSRDRFEQYHACTPADVKKDLNEILSGVEQTTNNINNLLDLRQAEYSRIQARDSAAQSNSILVFTIVTIVFLPLSFLSSLFALDVATFPHQSGELKYEGWWIFPIIFGVTAAFSAPTIALAWNVNVVSKWPWQRAAAGSTKSPTASDGVSVVPAQPSTNRGLRRSLGLKRKSGKNGLSQKESV
ncbi:hypothetical protein HD806DRAFT_526705 [Xylariaceae sp. AK1471]|nr:hypothetical protein HD806DRAFT_526705 [Xylariaceae sp. AK1471]